MLGNFLTRFIFIVLYLVILGFTRFILWGVLIVQILSHLFTGKANPKAQTVGKVVAEYICEVWLFLTYNTHERPFPFTKRKDQGYK